MPDTVPSSGSALKLIGLMAAVDLVTGIVLSVLGVSEDSQTMTIIGVALLLSGGGLLGWVTWQRNKPTSL